MRTDTDTFTIVWHRTPCESYTFDDADLERIYSPGKYVLWGTMERHPGVWAALRAGHLGPEYDVIDLCAEVGAFRISVPVDQVTAHR